MRLSNPCQAALAPLGFPLLMLMVSADRVFESSSLDTCQTNSSFTASLFQIAFSPNNKTLALNVVGDSSVTGNVTFKVQAAAYGYTFLRESLDPCTLGLTTMCPLSQVQIAFDTTFNNISLAIIDKIPSVAYGIPDLDATVTVYMYATSNPTVSLACVRSRISNGKTVNQGGVKWGTAVVAGLGLVASALVSALGHANTAAHVSLYASSLFSYLQAVAIIGLCAVPLPPLVLSWTQDFNWSLGIIRVSFLQNMATWYQIATGGTPATILVTLATKSVQVAKRSVGSSQFLGEAHMLYPRAQIDTTSSGGYIVSGMDRVAFRADMEPTNLFLTGLIFYCIFVIFALFGLALFKSLCELALRRKWIKSQNRRLQSFHENWLVTLKGIIFRLVLLGYPLVTILCLWEFTQDDSSAEIILAIIFLFGMTAALALAAFKVIQIAKRSRQIHKTPAYLLYADATVLKKWGFLYIQFRASAYYYVVPTLAHVLVKAMFVGLGQKSGTTQAIALVVIEAAALVGASIIRPWMDKPANAINITICAINFLNAIFLLIFTNIFKGPGLLIGVVGVVFFFTNVIFALVLLIIVLVVVAFSLTRKNPEARYQPIADNRASFIRSQMTLSTELDQLGFTARGAVRSEQGLKIGLNDSENDLQSSDLIHRRGDNASPNNSYDGLTPIIQSPAFAPAYYPPGDHSIASYESIGETFGGPGMGGARTNPQPHLINYDSAESRASSCHSNAQNEKSSLTHQVNSNNG
jgi:hypothetical protein